MFKQIPVTEYALTHRRLVYGVGINDADYLTQPIIAATGKQERCPFYSRWFHMLVRCYSAGYQKKRPAYRGCSVCDEWLTFSNFKAWMSTQDWQGKHLDKDIIKKGNKMYSPETCCFVSQRINSLLVDSAARRGKCPQGVTRHKRDRKYYAEISIDGKSHHLGIYTTVEAASADYRAAKAEAIRSVAMAQTNQIRDGLLRHAAEYD